MSSLNLILVTLLFHPRSSIGVPGGLETKIDGTGTIITTFAKTPPPPLWSWLVQVRITSLSTRTFHTCNGLIMAKDKILTPAHCLFLNETNTQDSGLKGVIVSQDNAEVIITLFPQHQHPEMWGDRRTKELELTVTEGLTSIVHPDFRFQPGSSHDIGVLLLRESLPTTSLAPIMSTTTATSISGQDSASFTSTTVLHINSSLEQRTVVKILRDCSNHHPTHAEIQFCATDPHNTIHLGDSGSPLLCTTTTTTSDHDHHQSERICGIVSYGFTDKVEDTIQPVVYTRLDAYLNWLNVTSKAEVNVNNASDLGRIWGVDMGGIFPVVVPLLATLLILIMVCAMTLFCRSRHKRASSEESSTNVSLLA